MNEQDIRNRVISKMLRKRVVGAKKQQIDTVVNYSVPTHEQGRAKQFIDEMLSDSNSPIEGYGGGGRKNIRLESVDAAVSYLDENDGDVPFGFG